MSRKRRHMGGSKKKRIRSRILQHEGVSQTDLLRTLNILPRGRPGGRRKGGQARIEFPFLIRKRDHGGREEKKEREEEAKKEKKKRNGARKRV
ncbi:hypothetical protein CDAR_372621 [Caerostris darwini]|uniref:Uncharacterized protein n=1 Tax=Caerostris darwini TaxID=1538125 RepID=A0AAV4TDD1_9ARAC|nr:hypothetical protein CDAR_372621 [Caerostris darwini]